MSRDIPALGFGKEKSPLSLYKKSPELSRDYLTAYSVKSGNDVVKRWKKLGEFLIFKYLDGNLKDSNNNVKHPGYPNSWKKRVVEEKGELFKVKKLPGEKKNH